MRTVLEILCLAFLPLQGRDETPSASEMEAIRGALAAYDAAWREGKTAKILDLFSDSYPCREEVEQEAARCLAAHRVLDCRSELLQALRAAGRFAAYAATEVTFLPASGEAEPAAAFRRLMRLSHFFLLAPEAGKLKILRMEEFDREHAFALRYEKLSCSACNFELSRPPGWFLVPRGRGWSPCTDSLSLIHVSGKITADFDILEALRPVDPKLVMEQDNRHLAVVCGAQGQVQTLKSRPFAAGGEHAGLEAEGSIQQECPQQGTARTHFWRTYLSRGPVLYSLNIYGEEAGFEKLRGEVEALRGSFRILDPALPLEKLRETMKARHNPGGSLDRNVYANQQYGVRLQGPGGWKGEEFSGPALFHVRFSCPKDPEKQIVFRAIEDPNGWPDEESVRQTVIATENKSYPECKAPPSVGDLRRFPHRGLQAFCYEAEWRWEGPSRSYRKVASYLPAGPILYVLELLAPAELFEESLPAYRAALDSLSRF